MKATQQDEEDDHERGPYWCDYSVADKEYQKQSGSSDKCYEEGEKLAYAEPPGFRSEGGAECVVGSSSTIEQLDTRSLLLSRFPEVCGRANSDTIEYTDHVRRENIQKKAGDESACQELRVQRKLQLSLTILPQIRS